MTNEDKAREIGNIMLESANYSSYNTPDEQRNNIRNVAERAALQMAQWKDEKICEVFNFVRPYLPAHITQEVKKMLNIKH